MFEFKHLEASPRKRILSCSQILLKELKPKQVEKGNNIDRQVEERGIIQKEIASDWVRDEISILGSCFLLLALAIFLIKLYLSLFMVTLIFSLERMYLSFFWLFLLKLSK